MQIEDDSATLASERSTQTADLLQRLTVELQQFDADTQAMGMNVIEVVEATQDLSHDDVAAGDADSVRGSMLSLTPSSSRQTFLPRASSVPSTSAI